MRINHLKNEDIESLILFTNRYTHKKRTKSNWEWEFKSLGYETCFFSVAEDNEKIVGAQALIPIMLRNDTYKILSAKSEETLVHPDYRGKRIFNKMYDLLFKSAVDEGIEWIWGFTQAEKPFKSAGFDCYSQGLNQYVYVISISKSLKMLLKKYIQIDFKSILKIMMHLIIFSYCKMKRLVCLHRPVIKKHNYKTQMLYQFNQETDRLQYNISKENPYLITVDRNALYMRKRIFDNPFYSHRVVGLYNDHELVGYAILAFDKNSLEINVVDILIHPAHCGSGFKVLLDKIKQIGNHEKKSIITFRFMPCANDYSKRISLNINESGFYKTPGTLPFVLKRINDKNKDCLVNNWYISGLMTEGVAHS